MGAHTSLRRQAQLKTYAGAGDEHERRRLAPASISRSGAFINLGNVLQRIARDARAWLNCSRAKLERAEPRFRQRRSATPPAGAHYFQLLARVVMLLRGLLAIEP
jgi:hypothetical protein